MRFRHGVEHGLFVREAGDPDRPPLVWLHGLGESGLGFEAVASHPGLSRWRHVLPDLPGYGRTAWPAVPLDFDALADAVAAWLRARGESRVCVLGHSMGGVLALHLAERHPALLRALVNVEGNLTGDDCTYSRAASRLPPGEFVQGGFLRFADGILGAGVDDPAIRGYYASLRQADPATYLAHSLELVAESEACTLAPRLAALTHAVLFIAGVPGGVSSRSLAVLRELGIRHVRVEPSGHWPFVDRLQDFVDALVAFLPAG